MCQSVHLRVRTCFNVKVRPRSGVSNVGVMVRVGGVRGGWGVGSSEKYNYKHASLCVCINSVFVHL